jgi:hypothetical protein
MVIEIDVTPEWRIKKFEGQKRRNKIGGEDFSLRGCQNYVKSIKLNDKMC